MVPEAGEDLDMPLETLNRMLTQLGVEPLSDPEARAQPVKPDPADEGSLSAVVATEAPVSERSAPEVPGPEFPDPEEHAPEDDLLDDGLLPRYPVLSEDSAEEAPPDIREWSVVRAPLPAPPMPRKRLRDVRYVAAPLHALTATFRRFTGWLGEIPLVLANGWKHFQLHVLVRFPKKKPDKALPSQTQEASQTQVASQVQEASQALESASMLQDPEKNLQTQPNPLVEAAAAVPTDKPLRVKKPLPQAVFWVGVPLLAILATICLLVGVLYLRELRQAQAASPRDNPKEEPRGWTYVPWTPAAEPSPAPFVVVGE